MPIALIASFENVTPVLFGIATASVIVAASYALAKLNSK